eukprot:g81282.t1
MIATAEAAKEGITVPPKVMGSAPDAVMGVKEVWAVMESELQLMLMGFLMTQPLNAPSKQQQQQAQMVGETEELSFNFEDSLALSVAQGSKLTDEEEKEKMKQQQDREKRANDAEEEKEEEEEEEEAEEEEEEERRRRRKRRRRRRKRRRRRRRRRLFQGGLALKEEGRRKKEGHCYYFC